MFKVNNELFVRKNNPWYGVSIEKLRSEILLPKVEFELKHDDCSILPKILFLSRVP